MGFVVCVWWFCGGEVAFWVARAPCGWPCGCYVLGGLGGCGVGRGIASWEVCFGGLGRCLRVELELELERELLRRVVGIGQ